MRGYVITSLTLRNQFMCLNCRERQQQRREFVRKYDVVKNRSPNVWRYNFVVHFHGPTISSAGVKHMDKAR